MKICVFSTVEELGRAAAQKAASVLSAAVAERGAARLVLSTGASQFPFFDALAEYPVDWSKVEAFHLDEYVGLRESHPASFRKYLRERFAARFRPGKMHYVGGEGDVSADIAALSAEVGRAPIDLGMIGIGENGHLAFNDPPADFETQAVYHIVTLNDECRAQQVREAWFPTLADVPPTAISMTVSQIMKCRTILSVVPHAVKAQAVFQTVRSPAEPRFPSAKLREHADVTIYLDAESSARLSEADLARYA